MTRFKEIYINGYRRKDGTWVCPHIRTIKISGFKRGGILTSYKGTNPNQLCFDFSGRTKTVRL